MAEIILLALLKSGSADSWAGLWEGDRMKVSVTGCFSMCVFPSLCSYQHIQSLVCACESLHDLPISVGQLDDFDVGRLKWDPQVHPWFPSISVGDSGTAVVKEDPQVHPWFPSISVSDNGTAMVT